MLTLDDVLNYYANGCSYMIVEDEDHPDFQGYWFRDFAHAELPEPSAEVVYGIRDALVSEGKGTSISDGIIAALAITQTAAFTKIIDSAEEKPAIMVYGILSFVGVGMALAIQSEATLALAKVSWNRFVGYASRYRDVTHVTDADTLAFNTLAEHLAFPMWFRLP